MSNIPSYQGFNKVMAFILSNRLTPFGKFSHISCRGDDELHESPCGLRVKLGGGMPSTPAYTYNRLGKMLELTLQVQRWAPKATIVCVMLMFCGHECEFQRLEVQRQETEERPIRYRMIARREDFFLGRWWCHPLDQRPWAHIHQSRHTRRCHPNPSRFARHPPIVACPVERQLHV